ncbi:M81 family metallopeptidase [Microlunatus sp. Gsoil 973]|uniref:M81 family metallopeptidase n=1 Tax=Microlunatus sp. Gsoil 973 TaxID=2672569 RepID=UPI0012B4D20F|nr:M81 family metallopeptidase [Microlunatus sp. Gsoil 973]QGN34830.1 microcystin degradation protein MlrC [Microlunatus sp. Gsoil 973]
MSDTPLASQIWCGPLPDLEAGGLERPRIGIGGMSIEASTYSPHISGVEAFAVRRGDDLLGYYPFFTGRRDDILGAADWVPLVHARSLPGGAVDPEFYQWVKRELITAVDEAVAADGPFDGFYFDIHGAMSVIGMTDAEGDLATALREALGPDTLMTTSMDLHGNVSRALLDATDLITCYRMAPHEDAMNTKERAVYNLLTRLRADTGSDPEARRPYKAWRQVPVLLPGEKTSTRLEPARSIYAEVPKTEAMDGVLDAAIWVGYAWADEPRNQCAVVVTGDDQEVIAQQAERLARLYWDARKDFVFVADALPLDKALDAALADDAPRPYFISDSGDNPTAGGTGDVSWTLGELLQRPEFSGTDRTVIHASIFDPAAVAAAVAAGVGGTVEVQVGGHADSGPRGPVPMTAEVFSITEGDPTAGTQVVLRSGAVHEIVTERRKPFHKINDFTSLGLDPLHADIVVVKIGYLEPQLYEAAAGWKLGLTPGGVDQDLLRLPHTRLQPGVYPFEDVATDPDLTPVVTRR